MTTTTNTPAAVAKPPRIRWWKRPWVVPLFFIATVFLAFSVPRYLTFDPANSFIDIPDWFPPYYALLVTHVVFAAVAMVTCCMQIWPWLRARKPKWHRISGRVYVFVGVLPAGLSALVIGAITPFGPVAAASSLIMAPLWLVFTFTGYRMARQRRFVEHRRWMIRSFALTMSIVLNRFLGAAATITLLRYKDSDFHGDDKIVTYLAAGMTTWLGWTICLLIAEWWLERGTAAQRRARKAKRANQTQPPRHQATRPAAEPQPGPAPTAPLTEAPPRVPPPQAAPLPPAAEPPRVPPPPAAPAPYGSGPTR
ncbi:DUF2306 domain-containing protein [Stackebrandtia nassauensis]|uniref:DUF2306 domain-containing protein n=1 Tax=Stackebrandtia nassauensis (strain DSM 44728 / CIP 108903 / NRRL B-16338 / NBRC 102104 / LLR-40K-21) TaxID=446470 RepID=D3PWC1_STANL|nr:DUF2306 domain-containing protein [Stackebrandtia nassauensis]ADD41278.1 hypothetical protein Snas_1575 [Stackebrandtia nassauensis DSM 44728]